MWVDDFQVGDKVLWDIVPGVWVIKVSTDSEYFTVENIDGSGYFLIAKRKELRYVG